MRRLPVYLVLDTSGSMCGEPIEAVKNGVDLLVSTLRQEPQALEKAYLSIITFSDNAKQATPLTELIDFQAPALHASGRTALGSALELLTESIKNQVVKNSGEIKGDWLPLVFIMTDGDPTDDWKYGLEKLKEVKTGTIVACAAGPHADTNVLKQITETVVQLDTTDSSTIKAFFKWLSDSITTRSQKVDVRDNNNANDLPPPPAEINFVL